MAGRGLEQGEHRANRAFKQHSLGSCSGKDAQPDMNAQQKPPQIGSGLACRDRSIALPGACAPAKECFDLAENARQDRKSTRLNSSHVKISYAVFCLKKTKNR